MPDRYPPISIRYEIKVSGASPALNTTVRTGCRDVLGFVSASAVTRYRTVVQNAMIAPNSARSYLCVVGDPSRTQDELGAEAGFDDANEEKQARTASILEEPKLFKPVYGLIKGRVDYKDIFNKSHFTEFCFYSEPSLTIPSPHNAKLPLTTIKDCSSHNEGD